MSGPECWHPFDGEITGDVEYCNDCGEPIGYQPGQEPPDASTTTFKEK